MATNSPFGTGNLHTGDSRRRQVHELIDIMSPTSVPFLKLVGIDGEAGKNPKFEWLEDRLLAESSAIAGGAVTATATTLNVTAGDGIHFQPGMLIKVTDNSDTTNFDAEYMYVTAVTTDALTVVRAVGLLLTGAWTTPGTTGLASLTTGDTIFIVGLANYENSNAPVKSSRDFTIPYNFFQAFDTSYQMSYIANKTQAYGVQQGEDARELEKAFKEVTVKLENAAFLGIRHDTDTSPTGAPRLMGGLDYYLDTLTLDNGQYNANLSGAQLTEKDLNDMLQNRFYEVGPENMGKTIICGAWNKRRINDMFAPYASTTRNERTGGVLVDTLDTDWGPIDVLMSFRCPRNKIYLVNLDFIKIHPYDGLAFFDEEKASSGAYRVHQIYGVYTMSFRNVRAMGLIKGTATS